MKTQKTNSQVVKPNTAAAFYRVSTNKQDNDRQISDVQKYCNAYGYEIVYEKKEIISGATKLNERKELKEFIKWVDENKPEYVICSELSRLARSQDALTLIKNWTNQGICFITLKENIKTLDDNKKINPMTELLLSILNAINVFELETIKYRVKSGLNKTVNNGNWSGGTPPYGYSLTNKRLVIDEKESEIIKKIFQMYDNGDTTYKIISFLNKNNIPTKKGGKFWREQQIVKILNNSIYIGKRNWNNEVIEDDTLRIIEDGLFYSVKKKLKNKENVRKINKKNKYTYLLSGIIRCQCGVMYTGRYREKNYVCRSSILGNYCKTKPIKIEIIENTVKKLIIENELHNINSDEKVNKVNEYRNELEYYTQLLNKEKKYQNYLIDNIDKIGQIKFEKKFEKSEKVINEYQNKINELNIILNKNKEISKNIISAEYELIDGNYVMKNVDIDNNTLKKIIKEIKIDNEKYEVYTYSGGVYTVKR